MGYNNYLEIIKLREELEVYKKALELACWDTMCNCLHDDYYNDLLQKARERNNDTRGIN